jgi:hypothetical protein
LLASGVKVRICRHQQRCRLFVGPVTRRPRSTLDYYCLRHEESQIERPCGLLAAGTPAHWPEDSRPTVRLASDQCPRWVISGNAHVIHPNNWDIRSEIISLLFYERSMSMAISITAASRALTWPMKRQNDHRIWA